MFNFAKVRVRNSWGIICDVPADLVYLLDFGEHNVSSNLILCD